MTNGGVQTLFDISEFETSVLPEDEERVLHAIAETIDSIRDQVDDEILEEIFRADPGRYVLRSDFTQDRLDPEPFTQDRVIEPLLEVLGYEDYDYEAGSFASERGQQADYSISLRDVDAVESTRLLIEAEPLNKPLDSRGHGIKQVKSWLSQREFESDYGFATDGILWIFIQYGPDSYTHSTIEEIDLRPVFLTLFENATTVREDPIDAISPEERALVSDLVRSFSHQNFLAIIDEAREIIKQKQGRGHRGILR